MKESKMSFSYVLIGILVFVPFLIPSASAEITVDWTVAGLNNFANEMAITEGNLDNGLPVSVQVTDTDSVFDDLVVDTIDVLITSTLDPIGTTLTLTETGIDTNVFFGDTLSYEGNFVILSDSSLQFSVSDTVTVVVDEDPDGACSTDDTITELDSVNDSNGVFVYSDSEVENFGIGLILTETGPNTCTFEGTLTFTDTAPSDDTTGTLHVSEGDILTFVDDVSFAVTNAQIIPTIKGKGSIVGEFENPDLDAAQVTATYLGVSANLDLDDDGAPGRGGGGLVRPGLVVDSGEEKDDFSDDSGDDSGDGSSCHGDCSPPTLGVDSSFKRIVSDGFSFNDNSVDVEQFFTPYPLVTVKVGEKNRAILKIYDDGGTQNIAHVEFAFGLGKDESFSENRAAIILDIARDGRESVTTFDPENVLDDVSVITMKESCGNIVSSQCLVVIIDHTFRESLEFNMVGTQVWDFSKNSWQNFFNHGIHIIGDSLNPPKTKQIAFGTNEMRGLFILTQIQKIEDKWIDEFGNVYQHKGNDRFDIIHSIPRQVIEDSVTMHGCDRTCNWFEKYKQNQEMIAHLKLDTMLGGKIANDLPSFIPPPELEIVSRADDIILQKSISSEIHRAQKIFESKYEINQNFGIQNHMDKGYLSSALQKFPRIMVNNE